MKVKNKNIRKDYITLLTVISAFSVVLLHTNGCFWSFNRTNTWFTANIIECIFYFAVPVFFMITGANLINYQDKYSTKEYFIKRIKKTLIPYIFWSMFGIAFYIKTTSLSLNDISFNFIFNSLFANPYIIIYWFFIELFKVYLCIPLLASVNKKKRKHIFSLIALLGFILNALIPFIINVFNLDLKFSISLNVTISYLLYVIIGYLLDNYKISKKWKISIYILGIIGLLMHIFGTYILSMHANKIVMTFKEYTNVPCILYSISIYVFVKDIAPKIKNYKYINILAKYTFPIYLMHIYIMNIFVDLFNVNINNIFYRLGSPFIFIPISILITYILRKIPIIKNIVP